jgi:EpsI family protein
MKFNPFQITLASFVIISSAVLAKVLTPHELMARTTASLDFQKVIPQNFGSWTLVPSITPVTPAEPEGFVQPDRYSAKIYSQEVARGYSDGHGNTVMLLVAYGPVQNYRLKAHRPEICYTANGFQVLDKFKAEFSYRNGAKPLQLTRLTTQRETRLEPVSYWMRVGNDIATGPLESQIIRLKYGLQGLIPDGALIRVSTVGLAPDEAFKLQDKFMRDLLAAVPPDKLRFLIGLPG